ncbi:hypothetical protein BGZ61DRAFT_576977 [Ilyonectria robusta]|uniref:uncharacterized protein n=1 Tax=Ilyonectria robusta TaxID=1079257 RepID=UPI001E8CDD3B|nr:uncharacterized protein BGZ61DRAFT_576977 [Ilyonectria robusta]KAH8699580.1 hypothetical protein BGZ61DRAFT_576977 [Ilyonectria robusta]
MVSQMRSLGRGRMKEREERVKRVETCEERPSSTPATGRAVQDMEQVRQGTRHALSSLGLAKPFNGHQSFARCAMAPTAPDSRPGGTPPVHYEPTATNKAPPSNPGTMPTTLCGRPLDFLNWHCTMDGTLALDLWWVVSGGW